MMMIVAYLAYKNIPEIERFDALNTEQSEIIKTQAMDQAEITEQVQAQYEELEAQYEEIENLNEEMNNSQDDIMQANLSLQEKKEKLRTTLGTIDQGVITLNKDLIIESANISACYIMKMGPEKAQGRRLSEILSVTTEDGLPFDIESDNFINGINSLNIYKSGVVKHRDGQDRDVALKCTPLSTTTGKLQGYVVVIEDVSELKKLREHMLNTSKLESLGVFAGGIAHDFNNFLTSMIGCISLAKNDENSTLDGRCVRYLDDAESIAFRARGLTEQLLTFAKGGEPVKKLMSIRDTLRKGPDLVLSGTNIVFNSNISDDLKDIEADESQIVQTINNILINAIHAMPGGGTVSINAENISLEIQNYYSLPAGEYVKIEIIDEGEGVLPEIAHRIFDPYFTTKNSGTGLGLSVVYSIIDNHGGRIVLDSSPEKGARFIILLPAAEARCCDEDPSGNKKFSFTGSVLLMDDDDMIRHVCGKLIESLGFNVVSAATGEDAVDLYRESVEKGSPFDLVILDLTVKGGMGGKEAFDLMRGLNPEVKALVSSGYSSDPVMADYKNYGFLGVLKKPYAMDDLGDTIDRIFRKS